MREAAAEKKSRGLGSHSPTSSALEQGIPPVSLISRGKEGGQVGEQLLSNDNNNNNIIRQGCGSRAH